MPLPEQARLTLSSNQPIPGVDRIETLTPQTLDRAINQLPFFVEHGRAVMSPQDETTLGNTNPVTISLVDDGNQRFDMVKYESWTDVIFDVAMSGYSDDANNRVVIAAEVTDQSGAVTVIPTITQFYFNDIDVHHHFTGRLRVSGLLAGSYTIEPTWRVVTTGHTFNLNTGDVFRFTATEAIPIP